MPSASAISVSVIEHKSSTWYQLVLKTLSIATPGVINMDVPNVGEHLVCAVCLTQLGAGDRAGAGELSEVREGELCELGR
jgi:hypothetical protein